MRPGMGSELGWEQGGSGLGAWGVTAVRGILHRGLWEPKRGDMGTVAAQGVLDQLPQNLWGAQSPEQPPRLSPEPSTALNLSSPTSPGRLPHVPIHILVQHLYLYPGFGCLGRTETNAKKTQATGSQEDVDTPSRCVLNTNQRHQGSPGLCPPREGHWGSSSTDPAMGDGAGAAHEALPAVGALAGLPLVVPLLVLAQVRAR